MAAVPGASVNEPHSFPAAGIWHVIVLGHRGRSDAICWHALPQHRLPIPLRPSKQQKSRRGQSEPSWLHQTDTWGEALGHKALMCPRLCGKEDRGSWGVSPASLLTAEMPTSPAPRTLWGTSFGSGFPWLVSVHHLPSLP